MNYCCNRIDGGSGVAASVGCAYCNSLVNVYQHGSDYDCLAWPNESRVGFVDQ